MSGPRILLFVVAAAAALLWLALSGGEDADLERGLHMTELAFSAVEQELAALDPAYQALRAQGLVLGLRDQHDAVRGKLAELKSRRVTVRTDTSIDRRQRLPLLLGLAEESDVILSLAMQLHRECEALVAFRKALAPLLAQATRQRTELAGRPVTDPGRRTRIEALAAGLNEMAERASTTERLLHENVDQGVLFGESTLKKLRTLVDEQERLLRE